MPRLPPVTNSTAQCLVHNLSPAKVVASRTTRARRQHDHYNSVRRPPCVTQSTTTSPRKAPGPTSATSVLPQWCAARGATVRVLPVDLGKIFPISGGLPLPKRAPQRQAYRLLELRRFSEALGVPLNLQPRFFPVAGDHGGAPDHRRGPARRQPMPRCSSTGAVTTGRVGTGAQHRRHATCWRSCWPSAAWTRRGWRSSQQPDVQARYDEQHAIGHRCRCVRCTELRDRWRAVLGPGPARLRERASLRA